VIAPLAHVAGVPIEETLVSFGPALVVALTVATAALRARYRRMRRPGIRLGIAPVSRPRSGGDRARV
jgi:hypothetical protein